VFQHTRVDQPARRLLRVVDGFELEEDEHVVRILGGWSYICLQASWSPTWILVMMKAGMSSMVTSLEQRTCRLLHVDQTAR
jgi:hypothetical protein